MGLALVLPMLTTPRISPLVKKEVLSAIDRNLQRKVFFAFPNTIPFPNLRIPFIVLRRSLSDKTKKPAIIGVNQRYRCNFLSIQILSSIFGTSKEMIANTNF